LREPPVAPGERGRQTAAALALVEGFQRALQRDDRAGIVDKARQLVAVRAPLGEQWLSLAMIAAHNGEVSLARQASELYVEAQGGGPAAASRTVDLLAQLGAWDEVLALLRTVPVELPTPWGHAYARGTAALYAGEREEARHHLAEATRLNPEAGSAWLTLGLLVDFAEDAELTDRLFAGQRDLAGAAPGERGSFYYAIGKAHADRGEHARAFAAYAHGAREMRSVIPYSREQDRLAAADAVSGYDAERTGAIAKRQSEPTDRAIFVLGLPRSGTTLVEQILTSHSAVSDGAETYRLDLFLKDAGGRSYPALKAYLDRVDAPAAARLWRHWIDERFTAPGRVVDKTIDTSRMLGFAASILPEAPLIWLTRNPLDCAWSCFRSRLLGDHGWSYDLEDIAFHFRLEDELRSRWQDILGERLLVIPFEELATTSKPWIRRILAHCRLTEEPQAFAPHENPRPVTTISTLQVRQPISTAGIGGAEPYREFMEPFVRAYYG